MTAVTEKPTQTNKGETAVLAMAGIDFQAAAIDVCMLSKNSKTGTTDVRRLAMTEDLAARFLKVVQKYTEWLVEKVPANDISVRAYTAGFKPDNHEIEFIDLAEQNVIADYVAFFPDPPSNAALFIPDVDFLADLVMYAVIVQTPTGRLLFFRKYDSKQEITRSRFFCALFSNNAYDTVRDPLFLFDSNIDCIAADGVLLSLNKHNMQMMFAFFEQMTACAMQCLDTIRIKVPIAKFDIFSAKCKDQLNKLTKLANIANKPYLQKVTMADLKRTIKKFKLPIKTVMEDDVEKIDFDPKQPWVILKLLDDDYLGSQMTKLQYEVNSKRTVS